MFWGAKKNLNRNYLLPNLSYIVLNPLYSEQMSNKDVVHFTVLMKSIIGLEGQTTILVYVVNFCSKSGLWKFKSPISSLQSSYNAVFLKAVFLSPKNEVKGGMTI